MYVWRTHITRPFRGTQSKRPGPGFQNANPLPKKILKILLEKDTNQKILTMLPHKCVTQINEGIWKRDSHWLRDKGRCHRELEEHHEDRRIPKG